FTRTYCLTLSLDDSLPIFLFIPMAVRFSLTDGIVVNSVLVTHYLLEESFAWRLIVNEFLLMILGVGFALVFNLYMPDGEKELKENRKSKRLKYSQRSISYA